MLDNGPHLSLWDVLSLGTFCPLGRFVPWDVLSLGPYVLGRFVLGRFVLGCFVCASQKRPYAFTFHFETEKNHFL